MVRSQGSNKHHGQRLGSKGRSKGRSKLLVTILVSHIDAGVQFQISMVYNFKFLCCALLFTPSARASYHTTTRTWTRAPIVSRSEPHGTGVAQVFGMVR